MFILFVFFFFKIDGAAGKVSTRSLEKEWQVYQEKPCCGLTLAQNQAPMSAAHSPCPGTAGQRRQKNLTKGSWVKDQEKTLQRQNRPGLKL